jgi:hypothetical protein
MQITIYYTQEDQYLLDLVEQKAYRERKSRSAVILTILEWYFEAGRKLGEILVDMGKLSKEDLERALKIQEEENFKRRLGEILTEEGFVKPRDVQRALRIQQRSSST